MRGWEVPVGRVRVGKENRGGAAYASVEEAVSGWEAPVGSGGGGGEPYSAAAPTACLWTPRCPQQRLWPPLPEARPPLMIPRRPFRPLCFPQARAYDQAALCFYGASAGGHMRHGLAGRPPAAHALPPRCLCMLRLGQWEGGVWSPWCFSEVPAWFCACFDLPEFSSVPVFLPCAHSPCRDQLPRHRGAVAGAVPGGERAQPPSRRRTRRQPHALRCRFVVLRLGMCAAPGSLRPHHRASLGNPARGRRRRAGTSRWSPWPPASPSSSSASPTRRWRAAAWPRRSGTPGSERWLPLLRPLPRLCARLGCLLCMRGGLREAGATAGSGVMQTDTWAR